MPNRAWLAAFGTALVLLGCGSGNGTDSSDTPAVVSTDSPPSAQPDPIPSTGVSTKPVDDAVMEKALDHFAKAEKAFNENNNDKVIKRVDAFHRIVDEMPKDETILDLEFRCAYMRLLANYRWGKTDDLIQGIEEIEQKFEGRLSVDQYRGFASDLAFAGRYGEALAALKMGSLANPQDLVTKEYGRFLREMKQVVETSDNDVELDPGYKQFMERTRPKTAQELVGYALRATNMKVHEKSLLALRDARYLNEKAGDDADGKLAYTIAFNTVLSWIEMKQFNKAQSAFEDLQHQADWISYHQVGKSFAKNGSTEYARRAFITGKGKHPDRAEEFERELKKLQ